MVGEPVILMAGAVLEVAALKTCIWKGPLTLAGTATVQVDAFSSLSLNEIISGVDGAHLIQTGPGQIHLESATFGVTLSDYGANGLNQIDVQSGGFYLSFQLFIGPIFFQNVAATLQLSVAEGFAPVIGTTFTIVNNRTSRPIIGTFIGLAQGGLFTADGLVFRIIYTGGDGNDVVLTRVS